MSDTTTKQQTTKVTPEVQALANLFVEQIAHTLKWQGRAERRDKLAQFFAAEADRERSRAELAELEAEALADTAEALADALAEAEAEAAEQAENARGHAAIADRLAQELKEAQQEARDQKGMAERYRDRFHKAIAERNEAREQLEALKRDYAITASDYEEAELDLARANDDYSELLEQFEELQEQRDNLACQLKAEADRAEQWRKLSEGSDRKAENRTADALRIYARLAACQFHAEREKWDELAGKYENDRINAAIMIEALTGEYPLWIATETDRDISNTYIISVGHNGLQRIAVDAEF